MPRYSDDDFLNAIPDNAPTTTHMIADHLGCSPATANRRLKQLHDQDDAYLPHWPHHVDTTPTRELEVYDADSQLAQTLKQLDH